MEYKTAFKASVCLFLALLLSPSVKSYAQHLGDTYIDIIAQEGAKCFEDTTEYGQRFIVYKTTPPGTKGGPVQTRIYFFSKVKSRSTQESIELCTQELFADTLPNINKTITALSSKFVQTGDMVWKDYSTDVVYQISINRTEKVFMVLMYYDKEGK